MFQPTLLHHDKIITCRAENPKVQRGTAEDTWKLNVFCEYAIPSDIARTLRHRMLHGKIARSGRGEGGINLAETYSPRNRVSPTWRLRICDSVQKRRGAGREGWRGAITSVREQLACRSC